MAFNCDRAQLKPLLQMAASPICVRHGTDDHERFAAVVPSPRRERQSWPIGFNSAFAGCALILISASIPLLASCASFARVSRWLLTTESRFDVRTHGHSSTT